MTIPPEIYLLTKRLGIEKILSILCGYKGFFHLSRIENTGFEFSSTDWRFVLSLDQSEVVTLTMENPARHGVGKVSRRFLYV